MTSKGFRGGKIPPIASKEALERLYLGIYSTNEMANYYDLVLKALERLEAYGKANKTYRKMLEEKNTLIFKYEHENEKLKKALDEACKILSCDCPCGQDLIDDLDCGNRCQPDIDYSECWLKYFIKEVLGND